ncbi:hypothetical protein JOE21_003066 [Desmospora profundinema]|uniref:Uncharacterized protein n=1 Tax=Desmospora profundinema TaxID=1571184 RepID=A0ABU1ISZ5_9BACL|nr:hypothetical protein [Desmospora profundinema]
MKRKEINCSTRVYRLLATKKGNVTVTWATLPLFMIFLLFLVIEWCEMSMTIRRVP